MNSFSAFSIILSLAIMVGYVNHRFFKLQTSIATMLGAMIISLVILFLKSIGYPLLEASIEQLMNSIDFYSLLMNGMLSFLLFAGAMNIDIHALRNQKWEIGLLASFGTIGSALLIAIASFYLLPIMGIKLSFIDCMLFGSLISATDPIAVLAIFKKIGAPQSMDASLAGESLFNDGVGVVMFVTIYHFAFGGGELSFTSVSQLFLQEAIGGIVYGLVIGYFAYWLIKPLTNYKMIIFVTLAIATGAYSFAQAIDISGPLAMVVAGIIIGNSQHKLATSDQGRHNVNVFWEIIDDVFNAILFLLIGFELLMITFNGELITAAVLTIPLVLLVRLLIVSIPVTILAPRRNYPKYMRLILCWGGLRGGLAVALALSIPAGHTKELILQMTYAVVVCSILLQGTTIKHLVNKSLASS